MANDACFFVSDFPYETNCNVPLGFSSLLLLEPATTSGGMKSVGTSMPVESIVPGTAAVLANANLYITSGAMSFRPQAEVIIGVVAILLVLLLFLQHLQQH